MVFIASSLWVVITLAFVLVGLVARLSRRFSPRYRLNQKHVWLIGCSRGIGRAVAAVLASRGAFVTLSARTELSLYTLRQQLGSKCARVMPLDITSDAVTLETAFQELRNAAPVDVVILNAAINQSNLPFEKLNIETIDRLIDTNLRAVIRLASITVPSLTDVGGVLCVVSSLAAYRGVPGASVYGATKAAITNFCQSLAVEYYGKGVSVVCVHPGFVDTPAINSLDHPKPFLMSDTAAAESIVFAIERRAPHTGFPFMMEHFVMRFSLLLPTAIYNLILSRMGR